VSSQAEQLLANGVTGVFICGTTGESHSLTLEERCELHRSWSDAVRGTPLKLICHVGHNCLADAQTLAANAQKNGAMAIAALASSYFKPRDLRMLVNWCAAIAEKAPDLPFYFYDIPSWTRVEQSMPDFLTEAQQRIPTLAGLKFTNSDLAQFLTCVRHGHGRFDILYGNDESLLAGLALGARGAVGSTFNFAAPIYHRLIRAFERGDFESARLEQAHSVNLVRILGTYGFLAAAKTVMGMIGVDCGQVRVPLQSLSKEQAASLRNELEDIGFFEWIRLPSERPVHRSATAATLRA
jgi:N-acetylneuraminate lyase